MFILPTICIILVQHFYKGALVRRMQKSFGCLLSFAHCDGLYVIVYKVKIFFSKTGELKYATHENFGYQDIVKNLLENGMSKTIYESLKPNLAEAGNEYEISKVSLF